MHRSVAGILLVAVAGCATAGGDSPKKDKDPPEDHGEPTLLIDSPVRGTILPDPHVLVRGTATDDESGIESVSVNGKSVDVADDGTFELDLPVEDGITMIETVARDRSGKEVSDRRSVLAGTFAPQGKAIADAVVAHVGPSTLGVLRNLVTDYLVNKNFADFVSNPFMSGGGSCFGYNADLSVAEKAGISVDLAFTDGGITMTATAEGVHADGEVHYKAACLGGSVGWNVDADAYRVTGPVSLSLDGQGHFSLDLSQVQGHFDNFSLDVGPVPSGAIEFFVSDIDDRIAGILLDKIRDSVQPMARSFLAELEAGEYTVSAFDHPVTFSVRPTDLSFDPQGGEISIEVGISIDGLEMGDYVKTPASPPDRSSLAASGQGFRVALADDVANQILAAFWAAGYMDQSQHIPEGSPVKATLGDAVDQVKFYMLLPPMAQVDPESGSARVSFGDILVDALDADGQIVNRFVASGDVNLQVSVGPDLRLSVETSDPDLTVGILKETGANLLTEDQLKVLATFTVADMTDRADQLLDTLPIPTLAETLLSAPEIDASPGYLMVGAEVAPMN